MAPAIVYQGIENGRATVDGLFVGLKFWFSNTVPQRNRFVEDVKSNGGEVVILEKQADVCLYDHARKNPPPGVYSYRFVEHSIRNGQLEDLESHRIGNVDSRAARPVGSRVLASRGSRKPFTEADDQMLWDWVKPVEGTRGIAGNLLYQQLEEANPRHTYQSWRDRWLKYVQFQNRGIGSNNEQNRSNEARAAETSAISTVTSEVKHTRLPAPVQSPRVAVEIPINGTPQRRRGRPPKRPAEVPMDESSENKVSEQPKGQPVESNEDTIEVKSLKSAKKTPTSTMSVPKDDIGQTQPEDDSTPEKDSNAGSLEFSEEDRDMLLNVVDLILSVPETDVDKSWELMAKSYRSHTALQWRSYFDEVVVPLYHNRQKDQEQSKGLNTELRAKQQCKH